MAFQVSNMTATILIKACIFVITANWTFCVWDRTTIILVVPLWPKKSPVAVKFQVVDTVVVTLDCLSVQIDAVTITVRSFLVGFPCVRTRELRSTTLIFVSDFGLPDASFQLHVVDDISRWTLEGMAIQILCIAITLTLKGSVFRHTTCRFWKV